jgi:hypothetical protein
MAFGSIKTAKHVGCRDTSNSSFVCSHQRTSDPGTVADGKHPGYGGLQIVVPDRRPGLCKSIEFEAAPQEPRQFHRRQQSVSDSHRVYFQTSIGPGHHAPVAVDAPDSRHAHAVVTLEAGKDRRCSPFDSCLAQRSVIAESVAQQRPRAK